MGSRTGLRMELHGEKRKFPMGNTLEGKVIEVHVGDLHIPWKGIGVNTETMVLGGDSYLSRSEILHRMVPSMMAELELEGFLPPTPGQ